MEQTEFRVHPQVQRLTQGKGLYYTLEVFYIAENYGLEDNFSCFFLLFFFGYF